MGIGKLWRDFVLGFRAGRQGGEAEQKLLDDLEIERLGAAWGKAKTPAERKAAGLEAVSYVLASSQAKTAALDWSDNPGAHEAYLAKRHNNPYFAEQRRIVTRDELSEAKRLDTEEFEIARQKFSDLIKEIERLPPQTTTGILLSIRERADDLIQFAVSAGGSAKEIASKADRLRDTLVISIHDACSNDKEMQKKIELADDYHREHVRKFYIPMASQLLRENKIIPDDELIPALMSEDATTISIVLDLFPADVRASVELAAMQLVQKVLDDGYVDPQFEAKFAALSQGAEPGGPGAP